jgi:proline iminopeptidase
MQKPCYQEGNKMKRSTIEILLLAVMFIMAGCIKEKALEENVLWPEIEPYEKGYLKVSEIHEIYYELSGNPEGKPVFVLHGGPGGSTSPYYRRFFDPDSFLIVLHDQRGSGQSRPQFEISENTTPHLINDIEKLRDHIGVKKIILFGGSWGSTLALAYGEAYPDNVSGMVLRGIFTASQEEIDHFYRGGVKPFFPETYEKLKNIFGNDPSPEVIFDRIQKSDPMDKLKYSKAWTSYEIKLAELEISDEEIERMINSAALRDVVVSLALIENYYMANGCFFKEGQLLAEASKIADIPIHLVNGRYDMICPPINAYRLYKLLPNSKLTIVESAGHWMGDKKMEKALVQAIWEFE